MTSTDIPGARIHTVDALRGFALVAILLVHLPEYLIYDVYRMNPETPVFASRFFKNIGKPMADALFFMFAGKSYSIFALLFGVTFSIQYGNRLKKGQDFCGRFAWRMVWLALFGCLNAVFFPAGDVLLSFALFGLVLIPFRTLGTRWMAFTALIFLLQPVQLFYHIKLLADPLWQVPSLLRHVDYPALKAMMSEGNFFNMVWPDLTTGQFAAFAWGVDAGRLTQIPGLFLLGCALGKGRYFDLTESNKTFWIRVLLASLTATVVFYVGKSQMTMSAPLVSAFSSWYNVSFSAIWVSGFVLLYQSSYFQKTVSMLNCYGKMSLTNYILHAVVGSFVFFPWGLNLVAYLEPSACVFIGMGLGIIQICASRWWLSTHRQGPLELLWHKLTWMKNPFSHRIP